MSSCDRSALPPKPAPRRRNRRPKEDREIDENYTVSGGVSIVKQTLPPDDDMLLVSAQPVPVARLTESVVNNEPESHYGLESRVHFTTGDVDFFQPYEYKRETATKPYAVSSAPEEFDCTHLLSVSSSVSCGEELLLASVPCHTLRIEPSPALTLDTRKHQNLRTNADGSSGRLKSSGSLADDLNNLEEMSSYGEPIHQSSSSPMLIGDGRYNYALMFVHDKLHVPVADCKLKQANLTRNEH